MDISTIALLLGAAGTGGAIGAAAAAISAGNRVAAAFSDFDAVFQAYFDGKEDPESRQLRSSFSSLAATLAGLASAFGKLKKALRIK
jgi:hypothetical protein